MNRWVSVGYLTLCLLTWLVTNTFAQTTILTGTVADASTGKPMPFVNVYLNGSTRGTLTNEQGQYTLANIPLGTVEVVASFVGYQPQRRTLRLDDTQEKRLNFRLKPSDQTLATITVHGNLKKWERHLKQFKQQLFGQPFGGQCQILNPDVLSFSEEKGHLQATATEPLTIENNALGYRIWYDLLYFDGAYQKVYYAGTARFEEMTPANERQANRYRRNRMLAYKGSARHLMASLVDGTYEQEGFMAFQENADVLPMKIEGNKIILTGSIATDSTKGHLQPLKLAKLIQPGKLPFERRLVSDKSLVVFYTPVISYYSPYTDARYAYSEIKFPKGDIQLTVDGTVTIPNGMEQYGSLADDRLSTMLPDDWQPATDVNPVTGTPVATQGKFLPPDARMIRIVRAYTDRFKNLAPVIYVHTDKPFYTTGDRLWLSAYLLDAATNRRPMGETALHADLVTATGKLVQHQWLKVTDGRATGNVRLSDSLASGTYRLRAYTDEDDGQHRPAFERTVAVYNLLQGAASNMAADTSHPVADIQLLPEGGRWIVGFPSRLGIKVVMPDGHGIPVSGRVITKEGAEITRFSTNRFGMGSVVMTPETGRTYYAEVLDANRQQVVPIPVAETEGLLLSADMVSDSTQLKLTIRTTNRAAVDSAYLLIQQQGRLVEQRKILLQRGVAQVGLPVVGLPPGLNQLTLYNASARPQAERLIFVPELQPPVRVIIGLNKTRYQPRERAILSLNLNDDGLPAVAVLSASVTDAGQVPADTAAATLHTHLLLTGELRGRVEQPNYYLQTNSPETGRALDDLLLTQGWRRVSGTPSTELLGGVSLMGRVMNAKNQPLPGAQVFVASTAASQSFVRSAGGDEKGRFRLAGLNIADTLQLMVQLADRQLNDISANEAHFVLEGPEASWERDTVRTLPKWAALRAQLDAARARQEGNDDLYRDKTAKLLKAVTVRAKKLDERPDDIRRMSLHNEADATLTFDDKSPPFANLYEMMRGRVAGVSVTQLPFSNGYKVTIRGTGTLMGGSQPLYLIDGMNIQDSDGTALLTFSPGDIDRIEVLKNSTTAGAYGVRGGNGVIAFYTKRFRPDQQKNETKKGMMPLQLIGYPSVQREFYVPRYDAETQSPALSDRVDRRDVLYWKPLMQTDSEGHSQLMFPLSDVVRTVRVTIQGITNAGRPVVGVALIQVQ